MWPGDAETGRYDFTALRERIQAHGLRNSMLTAQMPTASTATLLGNFDATDPYTRYVYQARIPLRLANSVLVSIQQCASPAGP